MGQDSRPSVAGLLVRVSQAAVTPLARLDPFKSLGFSAELMQCWQNSVPDGRRTEVSAVLLTRGCSQLLEALAVVCCRLLTAWRFLPSQQKNLSLQSAKLESYIMYCNDRRKSITFTIRCNLPKGGTILSPLSYLLIRRNQEVPLTLKGRGFYRGLDHWGSILEFCFSHTVIHQPKATNAALPHSEESYLSSEIPASLSSSHHLRNSEQ